MYKMIVATTILVAYGFGGSWGAAAVVSPKNSEANGAAANNQATWTINNGGFSEVYDLYALSESNMWAVGALNISHYNGRNWTISESITSTLYSMDFDEKGNGWAVGERIIYRFVDGEWSLYDFSFKDALYSVDVISESEAWAVGASGVNGRSVMYYYDGAQWESVGPNTLPGLHSVSFLNQDQGWAVGERGAVVKYEAGRWVSARSGTYQLLSDVTMLSVDNVWAVGGDDYFEPDRLDEQQQRLILHFDGSKWEKVIDTVNWSLQSIIFNSNGGWAVGRMGTFMHFDGTTWIDRGVAGEKTDYNWDQTFTAIVSVPDQDYLIAGTNWVARIVEISESGWRVVKPGTGFASVDGVGTELLWAVGSKQEIIHFDGHTWVPISSIPNAGNLTALLVRQESDIWAGGSFGTMMHFDGRSWRSANAKTSGQIVGFDQNERGDIRALSWEVIRPREGSPFYRNSVLILRDTEWGIESQFDSPKLVRSISALGLNDVWVAGQDGAWHFDGSDWTLMQISDHQDKPVRLTSIEMTSHESGWATGGLQIFTFKNGEWQQSLYAGQEVNTLEVEGENSVWAAGFLGYIYHFDGQRWQTFKAPGDSGSIVVTINDIDIWRNDENGWVIVAAGAIDTLMTIEIPRDAIRNTEPSPTIPPTSSIRPTTQPIRTTEPTVQGQRNCAYFPLLSTRE